MTNKKVTKQAQARALFASFPNITAQEIADQLKVKIAYAYVLLSKAKGKGLQKAKKKSSNKVTREVPANEVKHLQAEIAKYHGWCLEWRDKFETTERALNQANVELLDTKAIVRYLESKIVELV